MDFGEDFLLTLRIHDWESLASFKLYCNYVVTLVYVLCDTVVVLKEHGIKNSMTMVLHLTI